MDSLGSIKLGDFLGKGTYGRVYKIKIEGEDMALKQIKYSSSQGLNQLSELNYLRTVKHPNLLHCDKFTVNTDGLGFILPLAIGDMVSVQRTMPAYFNRHFNTWVYEVISAVHFLHKNGYYHCDIKQTNILIIKDRAVLSDLGLMGDISITDPEACQTFKSPQFYLRGTSDSMKKFIASSVPKALSKILLAPSTIIQDDMWALGYTIYCLLPRSTYSILEGNENIEYMSNPDEILKKDLTSPISKPFIPLLKRLMAPNPIDRGFNLEETLVLYPMEGKYPQLIGGVENIYNLNENPVVFDGRVVKIFRQLISKMREWFEQIKGTTGLNLNLMIMYNSIDLFYRIFPHLVINVDESCEKILLYLYSYCSACILIACNVNNVSVYLKDLEASEKVLDRHSQSIVRAEIDIVKKMNGILIKNSVCKYLNSSELEKGLDWINDNPQEYEKRSPEMLAKIIRNL